MRSRRFDPMAFAALVLGTLALAFALRSGTPLNAQELTQGAAGASTAAAPLASISPTFNYQGILRNPDGSLVSGAHTITIKIYSVPVGGTALNNPPNGDDFANVPVRDGVFNVVLGSQGGLPLDVFQDTPRYVGVTVDGGQEMTPRQRVHPVPWALQAINANTAGSAGEATTLVPNANVNGLHVLGGFGVTGGANVNGELTVKAIRDIYDYDANLVAAEPYDVSRRRWVIEQRNNPDAGKGSTVKAVPILDSRLVEYCGDVDGCQLTLGMRDWSKAEWGENLIASWGPLRLIIGKTMTAGPRAGQRPWRSSWQNGDSNNRWDKDGSLDTVLNAYDCSVFDYVYDYSKPAAPRFDTELGFTLVNGWGTYDSADMVCVLIIDD